MPVNLFLYDDDDDDDDDDPDPMERGVAESVVKCPSAGGTH